MVWRHYLYLAQRRSACGLGAARLTVLTCGRDTFPFAVATLHFHTRQSLALSTLHSPSLAIAYFSPEAKLSFGHRQQTTRSIDWQLSLNACRRGRRRRGLSNTNKDQEGIIVVYLVVVLLCHELAGVYQLCTGTEVDCTELQSNDWRSLLTETHWWGLINYWRF